MPPKSDVISPFELAPNKAKKNNVMSLRCHALVFLSPSGHMSQTGPKKCFIPQIVANTQILIEQSIACNVYT